MTTALPPVITGINVLARLRKLLNEKFPESRLFVVTDNNTSKFCLPILKAAFGNRELYEIKIKCGEQHKNLPTCQHVWQQLNKHHSDRYAIILNLGGGVICDLGGFAASIYKRGISFVHVPTTLLAMTDAAIGGKTGVDLNNHKNQLGTFSLPLATAIHLPFLKTLPKKEIKNGQAEIIKHALIADEKLWNVLQRNIEITDKILNESIKIKTKIVEQDFTEKNLRKALNFGHTIGHAIEGWHLANDYKIKHGEAVAAGILIESYLSYKKQLLNKNELGDITDVITSNYKPIKIPDYKSLEKFLLSDKKNNNREINFTLLNGIGNVMINGHCTKEEIKVAVDVYKKIYEGDYGYTS